MLQWALWYTCLFQFWFPQGIWLKVVLLGCMVVLFLVFKGIATLSSIVAVSIYVSTSSARGLSFLHTLSSTCCLWFFDDGYSALGEMISHCSFDFAYGCLCICVYSVTFSNVIINLCLYIGLLQFCGVFFFSLFSFFNFNFFKPITIFSTFILLFAFPTGLFPFQLIFNVYKSSSSSSI